MKFYYKKNNCLIYFKKETKKNYWDNHWFKFKALEKILQDKHNPNSFVVKITLKYLNPSDGPILEGGCGLGIYVHLLSLLKYNIIGIDNAINTIKKIKSKYPHLNIEFGDVKNIDYPDNYFVGYWSLGVIEHFFEGYANVIKEMKRIIKPNGFVFITFPYMSLLRKFKLKAHLYKVINEDLDNKKKIQKYFYQFILNRDKVICDFKKLGFKLIYQKPRSGLKGLKDEIFFLKFFLKKFLQLLYDSTEPKLIRYVKEIIGIYFSNFSGHNILLVFRNKKKLS